VRLLRPFPPRLSRLLSALVLVAWPAQIGWLVYDQYLRAGAALAGDLARYGSQAQWKGLYYRGEKIGFSVSETVPRDDGFELREDGQVQMALLGATSAARLRTTARVDDHFNLRSFSFMLDPGTGPISIDGTLDGLRLVLNITTTAGTRSDTRLLTEPPALSLNLPRRLAAQGLEPGQKRQIMIFDPATLKNAPMEIEVQAREVVRAAERPIPAFRVETRFAGITALNWITDTGEVVREESPTGFIVVRETRERATAKAVPGEMHTDMLEAVAIRPKLPRPIDDPRGVVRLRLRFEGAALPADDLDGVGQKREGDTIVLFDSLKGEGWPDPAAEAYLKPEVFIESDALEIKDAAEKATQGAATTALKAERLTRYVNALLDKKPTMSLPSALEVLRTRVGDCNEHTALYVALARSIGVPARIAVGLVFLRGAFYYHAWPEVYISGEGVTPRWIAVDPTLNEFPADATHLRIVRGGLDKQAVVLPLIGRAQIDVVDLTMDPGFTPVLVGSTGPLPPSIELPRRTGGSSSCWSQPSRDRR
jgi:transglutaminase-like putative cysteine protease